ncbi:MAG: hypothetical protein IJP00_03030 [Firmicutes bacterium]|nr:hypothetical protein [Bacillota bacterium]
MSKVRNKMSQMDRAKQFAPFAALKGQDDALNQYRQDKESRIELAEDEAIILNNILIDIKKGDNIIVTYYAGSCYTILAGIVEKVYEHERYFQIGNQIIKFEDIYRIEKRGV